MARFLALLLSVASLAGCAHFQPTLNDADCRHVLTTDGEPLRFCEQGSRVTVERIQPAPGAGGDRLIDNPEFLAEMITQMPRLPKPADGKGPKICTGDAPGYLTIKTGDFIKMVSLRPVNDASRAYKLEGEQN